jgi:hypothetical protein
MIVVLASAHDAKARAIVAAWAPAGARLCTPGDLSTPGWRHRVGEPNDSTAVIGGEHVPATAITGVLTRLPAIAANELTHIAAADRDYVASEITAFLIAFLAALPCPMLNRPSASALSGPAWRQEQWLRAAVRCGIPVLPRCRTIRLAHGSSDRAASEGIPGGDGLDAPPERAVEAAVEVTVVGDRIFGASEALLSDWAAALASAGGVGALGLGFAQCASGHALAWADPAPELLSLDRLDAARDFLTGASARAS